jgi:hypothetical protein
VARAGPAKTAAAIAAANAIEILITSPLPVARHYSATKR